MLKVRPTARCSSVRGSTAAARPFAARLHVRCCLVSSGSMFGRTRGSWVLFESWVRGVVRWGAADWLRRFEVDGRAACFCVGLLARCGRLELIKSNVVPSLSSLWRSGSSVVIGPSSPGVLLKVVTNCYIWRSRLGAVMVLLLLVYCLRS